MLIFSYIRCFNVRGRCLLDTLLSHKREGPTNEIRCPWYIEVAFLKRILCDIADHIKLTSAVIWLLSGYCRQMKVIQMKMYGAHISPRSYLGMSICQIRSPHEMGEHFVRTATSRNGFNLNYNIVMCIF